MRSSSHRGWASSRTPRTDAYRASTCGDERGLILSLLTYTLLGYDCQVHDVPAVFELAASQASTHRLLTEDALAGQGLTTSSQIRDVGVRK